MAPSAPLDPLLSNDSKTRLHSSRMRTACLLPVSPSMHCARGCLFRGGGVFAPRGGCLAPVGCLLPGGEGGITACNGADPLWTEFLTHTTENITLPQLRCER